MSARTVRRNFATPFVLTLAACASSPPPGPTEPPHVNPPPPAPVEPPHMNPPPPEDQPPADSKPAPVEELWTVTKTATGCEAYADISCPAGATCNPPPPRKIECPANATLPVKVRGYNGLCSIPPHMPKCPPNVRCNPPPPQHVKCPE